FFPGYTLEPAAIRSLLRKIEDLSDSELEQLAGEDTDQLIARFREKDARFDYRLTFLTSPEDAASPALGHVIASIIKGNKRIDVLPRDFKAIALDPPHVTISFAPAAKSKFDILLRTGIAQTF